MRQATRCALLSGIFLIGAWGLQTQAADNVGGRQYYGGWHGHSGGFSYRAYYYKPSPNFVGYKHHYAIQYNSRPQHEYFYNPYTKNFWGRCPAGEVGNESYSLLAEKDRSGDINKIPESAFPKPGPMPPIPESTDGAKLDLPPDDLPNSERLPDSNRQ